MPKYFKSTHPPDEKREQLKEKIKSIVSNSDKPIDVNTISKIIGCSWYVTYKTLMDIFIEEIEEKHPEILDGLDIRPQKTTKSMIFIPQK